MIEYKIKIAYSQVLKEDILGSLNGIYTCKTTDEAGTITDAVVVAGVGAKDIPAATLVDVSVSTNQETSHIKTIKWYMYRLIDIVQTLDYYLYPISFHPLLSM